MLIPSVQRCADNDATGESPPPPYVFSLRHQLAATTLPYTLEWALTPPSETVGICGKVLYTADNFVSLATYDLGIKILVVYSFSVLSIFL